MRIPSISSYNSYKVAKKIIQLKHSSQQVKAVCARSYKRTPAKAFIPSTILAFQALYFHVLPFKLPKISLKNRIKVEEHVREMATPLTKVLHQKNPLVSKIHSMMKSTVPDISENFATQVVQVAKDVNCKPEDLTAVLYVESKFDPKAKRGSFFGIGQMNQSALDLGIEYAENHPDFAKNIRKNLKIKKFSKLKREEQLPYVRNYLLASRAAYIEDSTKTITSGELYGLFLTPSNVQKNVLASAKDAQTASFYNSNFPLDVNNDNRITKWDLHQYIDSIKKNVLAQPKEFIQNTK